MAMPYSIPTPHSQSGRFGLLTILLTMIVSGALIGTGYWMGQQSHRELAGVISAPEAAASDSEAPANNESQTNSALAKMLGQSRPEALTGRWRVTESTRETPLRDVEFYSDGRVQLRDEKGGGFLGEYTASNGRLEFRAPDDEGGEVLFAGSYSVTGNRLTITHDDVVVLLVSGPEAAAQAAQFLIDERSWDIREVEKVAIRTDERYGCRRELAEALRDEDLEVVGEGVANAFLVVRIDRNPLSDPDSPMARSVGWHYFYSGTLLGKDDRTLFEYEGEVREETEREACEELAEELAEQLEEAIDD